MKVPSYGSRGNFTYGFRRLCHEFWFPLCFIGFFSPFSHLNFSTMKRFSTIRLSLSLSALAFAVLALVSLDARAQDKKAMPSPPDSAMVSHAGADMKVYYCRPSKKGREIFGKLVPFGAVWRTGANSSTEIVFSKDVSFGGKPIKAGRYSLFTIPNADKWIVILNSKLGEWGAYSYNEKTDVARVDAKPMMQADVAEMFTIKLDKADKGAVLMMMWDKTAVSVPVMVN
jgi:hypothetical protein